MRRWRRRREKGGGGGGGGVRKGGKGKRGGEGEGEGGGGSWVYTSDTLTGSNPISHVMLGGGEPPAWQSTEMVVPFVTHTGMG